MKTTGRGASRASIAIIADKKLYLSRKGLACALGVSHHQVSNYCKAENPLIADDKISTAAVHYFELWNGLNWYKNNINHLTSDNKRSDESAMLTGDAVYADLELDDVPKEEAERLRSIEAVKKARLQNKLLDGESISIDTVDKNMATQAATHISHLTNSEKILPDLLENKSASDIYEILNDHNQAQIEQLYRLTNLPISGDHELYDVFNLIMEKMDTGVGIETLFAGVEKIS